MLGPCPLCGGPLKEMPTQGRYECARLTCRALVLRSAGVVTLHVVADTCEHGVPRARCERGCAPVRAPVREPEPAHDAPPKPDLLVPDGPRDLRDEAIAAAERWRHAFCAPKAERARRGLKQRATELLQALRALREAQQ